MRDRERERPRHRQREKKTPCREPDVGLGPETPGSCPELKADTKPLSHPGIPWVVFTCPNLPTFKTQLKCHLLHKPALHIIVSGTGG